MKLLLDEMLTPRIAVALRERGHDAVAVKEMPDVIGAPDEAIMARARAEGRAVVTNNTRDFRRLHAEAVTPGGPGSHGLVLLPSTLRRTQADVAQIVDRLDALLRIHKRSGLRDREVWLYA